MIKSINYKVNDDEFACNVYLQGSDIGSREQRSLTTLLSPSVQYHIKVFDSSLHHKRICKD